MKKKTGFHNSNKQLSPIRDRLYENIFKTYIEDEYITYNILQQISLPVEISNQMVSTIQVKGNLPYTTLSYQIYKDISLWWLICLANNIQNPTQLISAGTTLRYIKPNFVKKVIAQIKTLTKK